MTRLRESRRPTRAHGLAPDSAPLPAPTAGFVVALALSGFVPLWIVDATPPGGRAGWIGTIVILILAGVRFAWIIGSRDRHVMEMVFWLFVYVFLGLAATVQLRSSADPGTTPGVSHQDDWAAIAIIAVGCLVFMVGSALGRRRPTVESTDKFRVGISTTRTFVLTFFSWIIGVVYIRRIGLQALFSSRDALSAAQSGSDSDSSSVALFTALVSMCLLVSSAALILLYRQTKQDGRRRLLPLIVVTLTLLATCVNPISSARYVFGTVALGVLAAFGVYETLRRFRIFALAALVGMVVLFPLADYFRHSKTSAEQVNILGSLKGGDFDSFDQIVNTVTYVHSNGVPWGRQALGVLLFWVPRSSWPGKPVDTGTLIATFKGYDFVNLSAPIWAEMFINGGWVVLVIGMFLLGYVIRRADSASNLRLLRGMPLTVLGAILPFYLLILCRGSLLQATGNLAAMVFFALFVTQRSRLSSIGVLSSPGALSAPGPSGSS